MMKLFKLFSILMILASPAYAQSVRLLDKVVEEGNNAYFPVVFFDESNRPVVPERVVFKVDSVTGTAMQGEKTLNDGVSGDGKFFIPSTDTASSMILGVLPCGNRIVSETGVSPEVNELTVWFLYPDTCTVGATTTPCKTGKGSIQYVKNNSKNVFVRKGTACDAGGVGVANGCLVSNSSAGSACDGTE